MVNLPEGKMKSREGTVVDADDLLDELHILAEKEIREKERVVEEKKITETASSIALGALNYYLLRINPSKDMIFNPKESISFNGDTGPYLQYMGARISSMLNKYDEKKNEGLSGQINYNLLTAPEEWELIKLLSEYPDVVAQGAEKLDPSRITTFLYETAKVYSKYYHDYPILHNEDSNLVETRVRLCHAVLIVLQNAFSLIGIPFLSAM
jgi:arginyl-tRNA synthetase